MAARRQQWKQRPGAILGVLRRAPQPRRRFTPRCVLAAPRRTVRRGGSPFFVEPAESTLIPTASRGEFAHPATPSNRRRCIRNTALVARGQPTDDRAAPTAPEEALYAPPTLKKKMHSQNRKSGFAGASTFFVDRPVRASPRAIRDVGRALRQLRLEGELGVLVVSSVIALRLQGGFTPVGIFLEAF